MAATQLGSMTTMVQIQANNPFREKFRGIVKVCFLDLFTQPNSDKTFTHSTSQYRIPAAKNGQSLDLSINSHL